MWNSVDWRQILALDVPPLLTAGFSAIACALLGNYLVLRRLSLMGDAISHSVLPGIVAAFLLTSSRSSLTVFAGAAVAAVLSAVLIEVVRRFGRLEAGAAMGVVFSIFFALGVLLIEQAAARSVDLDADCLLHGQLESIFWDPPREPGKLLSIGTLMLLPAEVWSSFMVMLVVILFVTLLYKELKISAFDPALSSSLGFSSALLHHLLMVVVACAVVASFKVVGSILVIAMLICPAASARLLTDRLSTQLELSVLLAGAIAFAGYVLGAFGPLWLGFENSVNAAGMMAVVGGAVLTIALLAAPQYGLIGRALRRVGLEINVVADDILAFLYRVEEASEEGEEVAVEMMDIKSIFGRGLWNFITSKAAMWKLTRRRNVLQTARELALTESGRDRARRLVRTHRLWEAYLVNNLGLNPDHVHASAERLEHFTAPALEHQIAEREGYPTRDPHGRRIPE